MFRLILFAFLFLICSCSNSDQSDQGKLNAESIHEVLDQSLYQQKLNENGQRVQIIDVRTPEEFQAGHLEGAKNINFYSENFAELLSSFDKNQPTFIYCQSGKRSASAAEVLKKLQFKEVYDLKGGYRTWK